MDELISILVNALIQLFQGNQPKPPNPPTAPRPQRAAPPPARQPQQRIPPPQWAMRQRIQRQMAPPPLPAPPPPVKESVRGVVTNAPPAATVKRSAVAVDAAVLRRWLRPQTLRTQFILTEVFQPPLSMREHS